MRKLAYLLLLIFIIPSCVKDEDKAPDTSNLPKRIKTAILSEHNVEIKRIEYTYDFDKLVKEELYSKVSGDWEMVNELIYEYDLPKVTLTVNFNLLGTWTTTAKIEYIIEDGKIQEMDDYTNFYDVWQHNVSTSYIYSNDELDSYIQENLNQDTVSYSKKIDYTYNDHYIFEAKQYYLLNANWEINKYYNYDYMIGSEGYRISGFDADSVANSEVTVITVGGLITKKETFLASLAGGPLAHDKTETFKYFQEDHLLYSDMQTQFLFHHVNYYYENAEGNASWFNNPEEKLEAVPHPKSHDIIKRTIKLAQKGRH